MVNFHALGTNSARLCCRRDEALKQLNIEQRLGLLQILVVKTLHRALDMKRRIASSLHHSSRSCFTCKREQKSKIGKAPESHLVG